MFRPAEWLLQNALHTDRPVLTKAQSMMANMSWKHKRRKHLISETWRNLLLISKTSQSEKTGKKSRKKNEESKGLTDHTSPLCSLVKSVHAVFVLGMFTDGCEVPFNHFYPSCCQTVSIMWTAFLTIRWKQQLVQYNSSPSLYPLIVPRSLGDFPWTF